MPAKQTNSKLAYAAWAVSGLLMVILAHHLAMILHEWTHGFMAWFFGWKDNPFDIHYGGVTLCNILMLAEVWEDVPYVMIDLVGQRTALGLIAITPPVLTAGLLFFASYHFLSHPRLGERPGIFFFTYVFCLMNLGNWLAYIPVRTFVRHGDIGHFLYAFDLSPLWVFVPGTVLVITGISLFLRNRLPLAYERLRLVKARQKASLLIFTLFLLFGFFGQAALIDGYPFPNIMMSWACLAAIPCLAFLLWPGRRDKARR